MKKGIILNLKRFKLLDYVTLNKIFIILTVLFVAGVLTGAVWLDKNSWLLKITNLFFKNFIAIHKGSNFFNKLFSCFFQYFVFLIVYFLSGASMLGVVVTPFITLWQGIYIGNIASYLYSQYGLSGIAFNAIILVPPLAVFVLCCFFAAKYSINFSLSIAKLTLPKHRPASLYTTFKDFCIKYLIFLAIAFICALIEIILNLLFLKFFNF